MFLWWYLYCFHRIQSGSSGCRLCCHRFVSLWVKWLCLESRRNPRWSHCLRIFLQIHFSRTLMRYWVGAGAASHVSGTSSFMYIMFSLCYSRWTESLLNLLHSNYQCPIIELINYFFLVLLLLAYASKRYLIIKNIYLFVCKHLVKFLSPIIVHELVYSHVATSDTNHKFSISDFGIHLFRTELVIATAQTGDRNGAIVSMDPICKKFVYFVAFKWLIPGDAS